MLAPIHKSALPFLGLAAVLLITGCNGVADLDLWQIGRRAAWQLPARVIDALEIEPGDRVADLGAGSGYFLPFLSEAVGSEGLVYAVDVDPDVVSDLETLVKEQQLSNVKIVLGEFEDPKLPEGSIDLVFLCNTYHHIERRPEYFARLQQNLSPRGRIAVVDPDANGSGVLHLFQTEGHMTSADSLAQEMSSAGYDRTGSHEFLPTQIFAVFSPTPRAN